MAPTCWQSTESTSRPCSRNPPTEFVGRARTPLPSLRASWTVDQRPERGRDSTSELKGHVARLRSRHAASAGGAHKLPKLIRCFSEQSLSVPRLAPVRQPAAEVGPGGKSGQSGYERLRSKLRYIASPRQRGKHAQSSTKPSTQWAPAMDSSCSAGVTSKKLSGGQIPPTLDVSHVCRRQVSS